MDPTTPQSEPTSPLSELTSPLSEIGPDENSWTARLQSTIANLKHLDLAGQVIYDENGQKELGGYCDVFVGSHTLPDGRVSKVAVKRRRRLFPGESDDRAVKELTNEMISWSKLSHPNILSMLGYVLDDYNPCLISEWMESGTVMQYLKNHPALDITAMTLGIASGLEYLHGNDIIHSYLTSSKVLVSSTGEPKISGFNSSGAITDSQTTRDQMAGTVRWMSPELLKPSDDEPASHTKSSDIWAFGMTIYELLTKEIPFYYQKQDVRVLMSILNGYLPSTPDNFDEWPSHYHEVWVICIGCWSYNPGERRSINDIVLILAEISKRVTTKITPEEERLRRILAKLKDLDLTSCLSYGKNIHPIAGGGYGEIRIGKCNISGRGEIKVAVKSIRIYQNQINQEVAKFVEREMRIWSGIEHENVLRLFGYSTNEESIFPSLISEFMENGTILRYIQNRPSIDVTHLVLGITKGMRYLHGRGVIHSDLKSDNILVSEKGEPLICDFGISRMLAITQTMGRGNAGLVETTSVKGSARWMSPELLLPPNDESASHTKSSDIWAFGMTIYELLSKERPYHKLNAEAQIISAIVFGRLPKKPESYGDWRSSYREIWGICEECWSKEPTARPNIGTILAWLKEIDGDNNTPES